MDADTKITRKNHMIVSLLDLYNATKSRSLHLTKGRMCHTGHKNFHVWVFFMLGHLKVASITEDALEFFGPCVLGCIKLAQVQNSSAN